jgi:hypothetical protein
VKKIGLIGIGLLIIVVIGAIVTAGRMGETSHAYARGRVVLNEGLEAEAAGVRTLFIVASGPDRPMPIGAFRKSLSQDAKGVIYEFVLTKDNVQSMMGDAPWPQSFKLKARLDRDGAAGPDMPGDLVGDVFPIERGQSDIEIRIDRVVN